MRAWIVDGMNVVGSRPDGWWRDRRGAMTALAERLTELAAQSGDRVTVVFDGRPFELEAPEVEVAFAPTRGRNAADDEIVRRVAAHPDPARVQVVTSDRELARRVRTYGAEVVGARALLDLLDDIC